MQQTLPEAAAQLEAVAAVTDDAVKPIEEVVADKGYHSRTTVHDLETLEIRTYISEPDRGPESWIDQRAERDVVLGALLSALWPRIDEAILWIWARDASPTPARRTSTGLITWS
jgi:hypothetical protein